jgi:hypothetical protein
MGASSSKGPPSDPNSAQIDWGEQYQSRTRQLATHVWVVYTANEADHNVQSFLVDLCALLRGWVQERPTDFMRWLVALWDASNPSELPYDSMVIPTNYQDDKYSYVGRAIPWSIVIQVLDE